MTSTLDPATLAAAEKVVMDMRAKTHWGSDAALLGRAAAAIHALGESAAEVTVTADTTQPYGRLNPRPKAAA